MLHFSNLNSFIFFNVLAVVNFFFPASPTQVPFLSPLKKHCEKKLVHFVVKLCLHIAAENYVHMYDV